MIVWRTLIYMPEALADCFRRPARPPIRLVNDRGTRENLALSDNPAIAKAGEIALDRYWRRQRAAGEYFAALLR